jgi:benzoyl-CoA reductase/2-hydroxyglutaryl-CoA dehydratase subunit BcrC/BadD/HgdB
VLKGEFDYLSAIVLPRANDSAHRLYYYLSELERMGEAKLPPILLCDVAMTPDAASRKYSIDALARLWGRLREIGDGKAGDLELRAAIALSNGRTSALEIAIATRTGESRKVMPATTVLGLFAATRMLPGEAFLEMAIEQAESWSKAGRHEGPRVIVCGSAHDEAGLHETVEAAGGIVVGDYHASGELSILQKIDPATRTPLEALADRHRTDLAASRRVVDAGTHIAAFAKERGAELAIFSYLPEEEALTWDYPQQKAALEAQGVRVLRIEQSRPFDLAANLGDINGFVHGGGA